MGSKDSEQISTNMTNNHPPRKKRQIADNLDCDNDTHKNTENWPRFIVITFTEPAAKLSSFVIQGIASTVVTVIKIKFSHFLVKCAKKAEADNLQCTSTLAGVGIKASPNHTLNSSRGVIQARDLSEVS